MKVQRKLIDFSRSLCSGGMCAWTCSSACEARGEPAAPAGCAPEWMQRTLEGSFSAVSKPNFASKYAFESSRRDLHKALLCTALKSHQSLIKQILREFCQKSAKHFSNFNEEIEIRERCKGVLCVDHDESFPTSI